MPRRAYTLIELIVSMAITLIIALTVFYFYLNVNEGFQRAERELQRLAAVRNATNAFERHLQCIVCKSGYVPGVPPRFKGIHDGFCRLQWPGAQNHLAGYAGGLYQDGKCRYLGFYSSPDGVHVDRIEYYFNPPEPKLKCSNGIDDDYDDDPSGQTNPSHLFRDDRGRLMLRMVKDTNISYAQYGNWAPDGADGVSTPTFPAFQAPHLTGAAGSDYDHGETVCEGFTDIYFEFLYTRPRAGSGGDNEFVYAPRWPDTADLSGTSKDDTGQIWPRDASDGKTPRGLSFLTLPLAVRITFVYEAGGTTQKLTHTIALPQSQWRQLAERRRE